MSLEIHKALEIHNVLEIHKDITDQLDHYVNTKTIPNILFYGPHGSGKKHIMNYLLNKIYDGVHDKEQYIMRVNCAFGKGIKFIREELKFFAKTNICREDTDKDKPNSKEIVKTIILLYGEHLTIDAQSALRRCIELFSHHTRFFIIVQDKTKILLPILSRMAHIYIPFPYIEHKKRHMNLHLYQKQTHSSVEKRKHNILEKVFTQLKERKTDLLYILQISHDLYEKGVLYMDVIKYIESTFESSQTLYTYLMEMDNIRHNICDEKMSLYIGLSKYAIRYLS